MDDRARNRDLMKALQIIRNLAWAEMVGLAQVQHLADDVCSRGLRGIAARAGAARSLVSTFCADFTRR